MTTNRFKHKMWHLCIQMEFQKIVNFLDTSDEKDLPRFVTKKWIEVYDQSGGIYVDLCDFSDAYIVVKETITVTD